MNYSNWINPIEFVNKAIQGDEEATNCLCKKVESSLQPMIDAMLSKFVDWQNVDDARHDLIVRVMERIRQLEKPELFRAWLAAIGRDVARGYRPPYFFPSKTTQCCGTAREQTAQPKQIGQKWQEVDGVRYPVRVFEASEQRNASFEGIPLFESLDSESVVRAGQHNSSDHSQDIDFQKALNELPEHWFLVMLLVLQDGYSRSEVGAMLGGTTKTVYRIFGKSRHKLRKALPGYSFENRTNHSTDTFPSVPKNRVVRSVPV